MITFVIPTYNAEKDIGRCLLSIRLQRLKSRIYIVDGGSKDNTLKIAKYYGCRIINNPKKLAEYGVQIGILKTNTNLVTIMAADNELVGLDWIDKVEDAFKDDKVCAVWGRLTHGNFDNHINRYAILIQNDPLTFFINPPYVWGANGLTYRTKIIKPVWNQEGYLGDTDAFQTMLERGHTKTVYFKEPFVVHHYVYSLKDWARKWERNIRYHHHPTRNMRWLGNHVSVKILLWFLYLPFCWVDAIFRSIKDRDWHWLYHPACCYVQTFVYTKEVIRKALNENPISSK